MELINKQTKQLLNLLKIPFSDSVVFLHQDFLVCIISIHTTVKFIADDTQEIQHALAHLVREITQYNEFPIIVDINGVEIKKLERLQQSIHILSERSQQFDKKLDFPALSSFERMLVHGYVSRVLPNFVTESCGEGKDRRLAIFYKAM